MVSIEGMPNTDLGGQRRFHERRKECLNETIKDRGSLSKEEPTMCWAFSVIKSSKVVISILYMEKLRLRGIS